MKVGDVATIGLLLIAVFIFASPGFAVVYAESGSMEPALPTGSVYIVDTTVEDVSPGDVVMYRSPVSGERVTHRVVGLTDSGQYITQGDANAVTDQAGAQPPLTDGDIVGTVPTVGDSLAYLPLTAQVSSFINVYTIPAVIAMWLLIGAGYALQTPDVSSLRLNEVFAPVLALAFVASFIFLALGVSQAVSFTATDGALQSETEVPTGETSLVTLEFETTHPSVPHTVHASASGPIRVTDIESVGDGTSEVTLSVPAGTEPEVITSSVTFHHYPPVLPRVLTDTIHGVSPFLAAFITSIFINLPLWIGYYLVFDPGYYLRPSPPTRGWF